MHDGLQDLGHEQSHTGKAPIFTSTRGFSLAPNRLHIQTWDTQKHQKTASMEYFHGYLGLAKFFEAKKNKFIASVHMSQFLMSNIKLSYFSDPTPTGNLTFQKCTPPPVHLQLPHQMGLPNWTPTK